MSSNPASPPTSDVPAGDTGPLLFRLPLRRVRWLGWRLRSLVVLALLGCVGIFMLTRWIVETPQFDGRWRASAEGQLELTSASSAALADQVSVAVIAIRAGQSTPIDVDGSLLTRTGRWIPDDEAAVEHAARQQRLAEALRAPSIELQFVDGTRVTVARGPLGLGALDAMYCLLCAIALALFVVAMIVLLLRRSTLNLLYGVMALCQVANLLMIALGTGDRLSPALPLGGWERAVRMSLDIASAAAVLHAASLNPNRLPPARWIALGSWSAAAVLIAAILTGQLSHAWAWTQTSVLASGLASMALLTWSYRLAPHPLAVLLRRCVMICVGALASITLVVTMTSGHSGWAMTVGSVGPVVFHVCFAALLLLVPFLSRSQQLMREFVLLASVTTVATVLDLAFLAIFSLGHFASITLALFLAIGVYAGARQWLMNRVLGTSVVTTERMFEHLYRTAREIEKAPQQVVPQLTQLLRDLFDPLEIRPLDAAPAGARVADQGSTLLLPVPDLTGGPARPATRAIAARFAQRGRRLFTDEDARLADRLLEQLGRAIAFDQAVEQGRTEERARIAQDLHDDIGARLLTLMYQAPTPELEEYVRHTLLDLKTLTRGLAAAHHHLSDAAAEWKADLAQRLGVAHIELAWTMTLPQDLPLSVVQWSGLTRVLRELVSNAIAHAQATRVSVELSLVDDRLDLRVADNGIGLDPKDWHHGLGLGGVRKRVKQLNGEVEWRELSPSGIACHVVIRDFSRER